MLNNLKDLEMEKSNSDKINENTNDTLNKGLKSQINELKNEIKIYSKKLDESRKKNDKEILSYNNEITEKDRKIHEYIFKISSLESVIKKKKDEYEYLKCEHNICQEITIKNKSNKLTDVESNMKENYENILSNKNKTLKKYENEIFDLNITIENLKKIEFLLKEELTKKNYEIINCNDFIKINNNNNEKITGKFINKIRYDQIYKF